jgi:hypothetical protein
MHGEAVGMNLCCNIISIEDLFSLSRLWKSLIHILVSWRQVLPCFSSSDVFWATMERITISHDPAFLSSGSEECTVLLMTPVGPDCSPMALPIPLL